ncbi:MAG: SDR family oxidoreductase, partial [Alphaproteobacteria bacterium]|nr:SDR family oxidoreductase [Alphaproteobacteria bacterium]
EVGGAGLFLLSDLGSGVTGEIMYVDSGYNTTGMVAVDSAKQTAELLQGVSG